MHEYEISGISTFWISFYLSGGEYRVASKSEPSEWTSLWTCFLEWDTDLDFGDLEEEVDLGLILDLGARRGDETLGMVSLTIFTLWMVWTNISWDEGVVEETCLAGHFFLLARRSSAKDASFLHLMWWAWGVISKA